MQQLLEKKNLTFNHGSMEGYMRGKQSCIKIYREV